LYNENLSENRVLIDVQTAARDALLEAGVTPYNGGTYEHMVGTKIGGSIFDSTGHRHTAADLLTYANPSNLTVYIWANAHQLLFDTNSSGMVSEFTTFDLIR
jgi:hypothetical protein